MSNDVRARARDRSGARTLHSDADFYGMIGRSPAMRRLFRRIERFAASNIPVLITGETGTGKEMVARAIGRIFAPDRRPVAVNCAAIPETLIESELFGHEKGAFTGAVTRHTGLVGRADGGILFLDEVGELPPVAQAKLLRVIDTGTYSRVGGETLLRSRFRVVAATNRDLERLVDHDGFRLDLMHRLGTARIALPPLHDRMEDLPALAHAFLRGYRDLNGGHGPTRLSAAALRVLRGLEWPGNVRQLRNVMHAAAALARGRVLEPADIVDALPPGQGGPTGGTAFPTLADVVSRAEAKIIRQALRHSDGDTAVAAELLGVSRATLYRRLSRMERSADAT